MSISYFKLGLVAAVLAASAGAANAQFIEGASSTFTGATVQTYNDATVTNTGWYLGGTGNSDGSIFASGGQAGAYMAINNGNKAAILLTPSLFTGISGNFDYTLSAFVNSGTTTGASATWKLVSASSAVAAIANSATTLTGYLNSAAHTVANQTALTGTWAADAVVSTWDQKTSTFSLLASATNYTDVYLVLTANATGNGNYFAIDTVTAVPEPESYAMFAAGIGAIGFMSRRRKNFS